MTNPEPFVTRYEVSLMLDTIKEMIKGQGEHFDDRFDANDKAVNEAKESSEKAVATAREVVVQHDVATNEFRKQIGEERADYARKPEVAFQLKAVEERIPRPILFQPELRRWLGYCAANMATERMAPRAH